MPSNDTKTARLGENFSMFEIATIAVKDAAWLLAYVTPHPALTECCQNCAPPDVIAKVFEFPNHDYLFLEIDRETQITRAAAVGRLVRYE